MEPVTLERNLRLPMIFCRKKYTEYIMDFTYISVLFSIQTINAFQTMHLVVKYLKLLLFMKIQKANVSHLYSKYICVILTKHGTKMRNYLNVIIFDFVRKSLDSIGTYPSLPLR